MTILIADLETDGLLPDLTKIWTLQLGDLESDEVTVYADQPTFPPLSEGIARLREAEQVVFHNGIGFDWHVVERFYPKALGPLRVVDTLIMARLAFPDERSHALKVWGERLGVAKGDYEGDFQSFTEDLARIMHEGRRA